MPWDQIIPNTFEKQDNFIHILMAQLRQKQDVISLKFRCSEKVTKIWPIFHSFFDITWKFQIINGKWAIFCGLLRISEHYDYYIDLIKDWKDFLIF